MEKKTASSLFVNDGSFMERFKQLQQKEKEKGSAPMNSSSIPVVNKPSLAFNASSTQKTNPGASSGKLAFSLKQKSKLVTPPVKLGGDDDEDEINAGSALVNGSIKRLKTGHTNGSSTQGDVASPFPSDPTEKNVADKLASFVAKNGRHFEDVTRQKNPGDTPFKFLFDESCGLYKYYKYRLIEEENALSQTKDSHTPHSGVSVSNNSACKSTGSSQRLLQEQSNYQIPASALYEAPDDSNSSLNQVRKPSTGGNGESSGPTGADPIAMMEYYMKKAAHEEKRRAPKQSKDEMPPPASLQGPAKKGHHMGDYIPDEELLKFMSNCNDVAAQKAAKEAADRAKIQADNVGHKLLSKMGWKEGEGLGSSKSGIADPIKAGDVKINNLGVGAQQPGEVTPEDDIYEQYKKRMMLGYKFRPNPLNNPRKAYY